MVYIGSGVDFVEPVNYPLVIRSMLNIYFMCVLSQVYMPLQSIFNDVLKQVYRCVCVCVCVCVACLRSICACLCAHDSI